MSTKFDRCSETMRFVSNLAGFVWFFPGQTIGFDRVPTGTGQIMEGSFPGTCSDAILNGLGLGNLSGLLYRY